MILLTLAALALFVVASFYGSRRYRRWRDVRDLRIRYERLRRFCIVPYNEKFSPTKKDRHI